MNEPDGYDGRPTGPANVVPFRGGVLAPYGAGYSPAEPYGPNSGGFDFWGALKTLGHRKWMIAAILGIGLAATAALTLRQVPLYKSSATIEIQKQETRIVEAGNVTPAEVADAEAMATQYALLRSRSLAERVAEALDLSSNEKYADQTLSREKRLNAATEVLQKNLEVAPITRSRVVQISYSDPSAVESARIANAFADGFIESNLERKYNATSYARNFLEDRLRSTKEALETSERKLVEYARENKILDLGQQKASEVGDSLNASTIVALNSALTDAENKRIATEQKYLAAKSDPAALGALESEAISELKKDRAKLSAEYQEKLLTFKPDYPDMLDMKGRIDGIDQEIDRERTNIVSSLDNDYKAAAAAEASLRRRVGDLGGALQQERGDRIDYTILQREVDTNRAQYDALLQRLKEVSIASGVGTSQVSIVDRARKPDFPFSPNYKSAFLRGVLLSLALGIALAFVLEYIDDTIKSTEDVTFKLGLPCIGVVPKVKGDASIVEHMSDPRSRVAEAFFSARTALQFSTPQGAPKCMLITGNRPAEGKSSTCLGLAMSFAGLGKRVLIIDADMRRPSFEAPAHESVGLSGLLTSSELLSSNVLRGSVPNLFLLPAGTVPPNPAELLASPRLRHLVDEAKEMFDLVLIDSPPVMGFADSPLLASVADGAVIVVHAGVVRRPIIMRTIGRLLETRSNLLGVILSKYEQKHEGYGYGYHYAYNYGGAEGDDKKPLSEVDVKRRIQIVDSAGRDDKAWPA